MRKKLILLLSLILTLACICSPLTVSAATFNIDTDIESKAAFLYNLDTNSPVYEKNADERRSMASTTKIMTYIVVMEHVDNPDTTMVTISKDLIDRELAGTDSSVANLADQEQMSVTNLLHCLMIPSGNDAAVVLADYVGGGNIQAFVDMMNAKAAELGCENTHFTNPHGLYDAEHYTTARDLVAITKHALTLPYFTDITNKTYYELPTSNVRTDPNDWSLSLNTTNMMMIESSEYFYEYVKGVKTGFLDEAGNCFVSTASTEGYSYLCVILGGAVEKDGERHNGAFDDTKTIYKWAFNNLEYKSIVDTASPATEIGLDLAWQKDTIKLMPEKSVTALLPKDVELSSIMIVPNDDVPKSTVAPVKKGQKFGTATLMYANQELGTVDLVASEDVDRSDLLFYLEWAQNIVTSKWFIFGVAVFFLLFIIYLIVATIYNRRNRRRRKVKKYRKL